ncbi:hypothetical protein [Hymenobacter sp. DG25A]|uniref:hypothetical protein n=1 Tax=Hymenobacter sp. DG25A TaxID=1385663 RepID=UPI0006BDE670|nr:hypothetical protein [Hymenobacter sp. DG25A]ALD21373.1 hypothetical protein AM218_09290 [Hymenobacter sp. DG25A]
MKLYLLLAFLLGGATSALAQTAPAAGAARQEQGTMPAAPASAKAPDELPVKAVAPAARQRKPERIDGAMRSARGRSARAPRISRPGRPAGAGRPVGPRGRNH